MPDWLLMSQLASSGISGRSFVKRKLAGAFRCIDLRGARNASDPSTLPEIEIQGETNWFTLPDA